MKIENTARNQRTNAYGLKLFSREKTEFIAFYKENLEAELTKLEKERKKFMSGLIKILLLCPFVYALVYFGFRETSLLVVIVAPLMIMGWPSYYWMTNKQKIEARAKGFIVPELIKFMNPNFTYQPEVSLTKQDVDNTYMFKHKVDALVGDDLIVGYVRDEVEQTQTNIAFSEVCAIQSHNRDPRGNRIRPTGVLMIGLLFKADFNKDFGNSVTMIKPRWLLKKKKHRKKLRLFDKKSVMQEVHLENPAFMKRFIVHTNNQIDARVILQADTMDNILDFVNYIPDTINRKPRKRKRKHHIPYFTFRQNQVYVMMHTQANHFGLNIMKELDIDAVYDHFKDVNRVLRFVDNLNLNLDVYKK